MRYVFLVRIDGPDHHGVHSVWDDRSSAIEERDRLNKYEDDDFNAIVEVWALGMGTFGLQEILSKGDE